MKCSSTNTPTLITSPRMETKLSLQLGIVILLGIAILFGANHVAARVAFEAGASVTTAVLVRAAGTAILLFALMRFQGIAFHIPPALRSRVALLGIVMALQSYSLYSAVALIPAALALLVFNTYPILFVLFSWITAKERPRLTALLPMALALIGMALALNVTTAAPGSSWSDVRTGAMWALAGAAMFALLIYGNAHLISRMDGRLRTLATTAITAFVVLLVGLPANAFSLPRVAGGWIALGLLTLLYGTATLFLFIVLPRLSSAATTVALNVEPVAVLALASIFLGQTLSGVQTLGMFIVIGAVVVLNILNR